jgi:membrane fusion protein, macrolide-specific efflux system
MSPAVPSSPLRRRPIRWVLALALLAALAAAAWWAWQRFGQAPNPRETYQIVKVQRGDIEDLVTATGTLQPRDYVDVGAQVSGQLNRIHVEVGTIVKEGDLLAEIDATVYTANVDARRASLRNQRATMVEREAQLRLAQIQYERQKNLMAADATTQESLQQAETALAAAQAQIQALKAQIEQAESTLRADEANLRFAKIYAPMDGTVVSITARQGQTLNTNQSAPILMRIADLSTMTVQTQVSEADVSKLRIGMPAYFTILGGQGRRWHGELRKIEPTPTVTNNVVLYNALFDVPNPNQTLMTQMTAQVFFVAAAARDAMWVPAAAVSATTRRAPRDATQAPASAGAANGVVAMPVADGLPSRETLAAMTPDERRLALERLSPDQRQALRERRAAAGAAGNGEPQRATVRVIDAQGHIAERMVELGVSNRVQVQVLSGLDVGDEVVAGLRQTAARGSERSSGPPANPLGLGGGPRR